MFAVIINTIAIVIGTSLGLIFKKGIPERVSDIMMKVMGLCVVIIGLHYRVVDLGIRDAYDTNDFTVHIK